MKVTEIAFTCYPVTDLKRACQFYEGALGLKEARFWGDETKGMVEYDIGPGTLAIGAGAPQWKRRHQVADAPRSKWMILTGMVSCLREHKCKFVIEPMETPACHMACLSDPDGNSFIIHKRKAT